MPQRAHNQQPTAADPVRRREILLALAQRRRDRIERGVGIELTDEDCARSTETAMRLSGSHPDQVRARAAR